MSTAPQPEPTILDRFHPATRAWFGAAFAAPTPVQERGWARIAAGEHTLMLAPTGSGKTLAAFLWCLDRLLHHPAESPGFRTLYISPIKALAYDIERNLDVPLRGIRRVAGAALPELGVDVRTGDTPQKERARQKRRPGDILITTPESLFLLLGSEAREALRTVETVIIDEIHAVAGTKRGVHLALSLERLAHLTGREPQRIGLSATQRPLEEVARYLGGDRPVAIVDASEKPRIDLEIVVPVADMEAPLAASAGTAGEGVPSGPLLSPVAMATPEERTSIWPSIYPRLLELIRAHHSTIIFANSRRLAERLSQQINELAQEELVRAHHGSVARHQRAHIEEMLKAGQLRAIAATSSLELGIDMGAVDLVVQIESPGAVSRGLQRIGRAGHAVGEVSRGRIFPKFRGDLLEAAVCARRMLDGEVESVRVPTNTLDVLAQHLVSMCAMAPWQLDELERLVRRAHSFRELSREALVAVLDMLSGRYPSDEFAELRPRLTWDRTTDTLTARRGARMLAAVNAGTIPDRGLYPVHLGEDGPRVGELDEEMVHEARPGETFLLGATTWRIEEITRDRIIVSPAPGEPGKMPFWRGEGPGRPIELGRAVGALVRRIDALPEDEARRVLRDEYLLDDLAAGNLIRYIADQRADTGTVPSDRGITIERFRDELGDWRICILTPFGARVHAPWALALEAVLGHRAGVEVQALWSDDGIALRFPDADELPGAELLVPDPDAIEDLVVEQLAQSALFASAFRENAARALLLPRRRPGQRTPLWTQRLRAQNLLAVAMRFPSFPIVLETYRQCLQEVFDLPALVELLGDVRNRRVRVDEVETAAASPFARSLVFAYVAAYLYEGDAPLAERKAQALTIDRNLLRDLLGAEELRDLLDAAVLDEVEDELQHLSEERRIRHADALHDLLRRLGDLTAAEIRARSEADPGPWLDELERARRIARLRLGGEERYVAVEDVARYRDAFGAVPPPGLPQVFLEEVAEPVEGLLLRYARCHTPFTAEAPARRYGWPRAQVEAVYRALAASGRVLGGAFRPGGTEREWCDPEVLRQLRRRTLAKLRNEVAPVDAAVLGRFLPRWHGIGAGRKGPMALADALAQLEGLPIAFSELERRILPARVADFHPRMLDQLGAMGQLIWVGRGALGAADGRVVLLRRERAPMLLDPPPAELPEGLDSELHRRVLAHLRDRGASFFADLQAVTGAAASDQLLDALWDLVWAGQVTNDTFGPLRGLKARKAAAKAGSRRGREAGYLAATGRWSAVAELCRGAGSDTERAIARAEMLLERYGVVTREAAASEGVSGGFSASSTVLRAMEEAGKIRRGYFVEGLGGAQFAHIGAIERLRGERDRDEPAALVLAAVDPVNPWGALLPWPTPAAANATPPARRAGASVVLVRGVPVLYLDAGRRKLLTFAGTPEADLEPAILAGLPALAAQGRRRTIRLELVDDQPARTSRLAPLLERAGFRAEYRGLTLEAVR